VGTVNICVLFYRPLLLQHAGMKLQVMAKVVKHLEPLQVRALGCGMPLQAMQLLVTQHREGTHRVTTKEHQVGETDGMKHPKQSEVSYFNWYPANMEDRVSC
jgi:hypothetical protein